MDANATLRSFAAALAAVACAAHAQGDYASKPVRLIVPFAAGGATDVLARVIGPGLSARLGQPVIVENRLGANGVIGAEAVAKSPPDGYTLLVGTIATHGIQPVLLRLPYDADKGFAPIVQIASQAYAVVAYPGFPPNTMQELVALAKQQPGKINYASASKGTGAHLFAELFKSLAGVDIVAVHYKGAAPAMNDVLGGHVPFTFDVVLTTLAQIKSGKLKALAVTSRNRSPVLPGVPTIAESGFPGYDAVGWNGLFAPAGTPPAVLDKIAKHTDEILRLPEVHERVVAQGAEPVGGTPAQFAEFIRAERAKWERVVKAQHITAD